MPAARPKYSLAVRGGAQVYSLTFNALNGAALLAWASVTLFRGVLPMRAKCIGARLNVEARGGTHATSTIDVTVGGTSILAAPFDVAALTPATPVDKEIASLAAGAANLAANSEIVIAGTVSGGSSPTLNGVTVQLDFVALGD